MPEVQPEVLNKDATKKGSPINFARGFSEEINAEIDDMFDYHQWTAEQVEAGQQVREALAEAVKVIVQHIPPSADRTTAIRKIREARMDANSAITHNGKY